MDGPIGKIEVRERRAIEISFALKTGDEWRTQTASGIVDDNGCVALDILIPGYGRLIARKDGSQYEEMGWPELAVQNLVEEWNRDPTAYAAKMCNVSRADYVDYVRVGGRALCSERTQKGKLCNHDCVNDYFNRPAEWVKYHRRYPCPIHSRGLNVDFVDWRALENGVTLGGKRYKLVEMSAPPLPDKD